MALLSLPPRGIAPGTTIAELWARLARAALFFGAWLVASQWGAAFAVADWLRSTALAGAAVWVLLTCPPVYASRLAHAGASAPVSGARWAVGVQVAALLMLAAGFVPPPWKPFAKAVELLLVLGAVASLLTVGLLPGRREGSPRAR